MHRWSSSGGVFQFVNASPPSFSDHGTELAWGVGTQVHVSNIGTNAANIVSLALFLNIF